MSDARHNDPRLAEPDWCATAERGTRWRVRLLVALALPLAAWYFGWLLHPERIGHPALYALLIAAELFNLVQAAGFWWTSSRDRERMALPLAGEQPDVDVLVPVYDEPVEIVEPTIAAATRLRCANVHVALLDDGGSDEMRALADRHGVRYIRRGSNAGAKAGNINHALGLTKAPYVLVLDCDHVPDQRFLLATLGHLADERVAFVQTPQYYANHSSGPVAAAAWAQQALFFGAIARGKDGHGAMFCCGTNVVFRRGALESVGGFPEDSVTEDFELSVRLQERGWRTAYVPYVLARGLGPEDMASYVGQQMRWARGCLGAAGTVFRSRLPFRLRAQYLLSAMFFLSGWTVLAYMAFPVIRILSGEQPLAVASADQFLLHFAPYFSVALLTVAVAGAGSYTFGGFALQAASFWIHVQSAIAALLRRGTGFKVTPKQGASGRQPLSVAPALLAAAVLACAGAYGLWRDREPSTLNNVAFAALHVWVLTAGAMPALVRRRQPAAAREPAREREELREAA